MFSSPQGTLYPQYLSIPCRCHTPGALWRHRDRECPPLTVSVPQACFSSLRALAFACPRSFCLAHTVGVTKGMLTDLTTRGLGRQKAEGPLVRGLILALCFLKEMRPYVFLTVVLGKEQKDIACLLCAWFLDIIHLFSQPSHKEGVSSLQVRKSRLGKVR